MKITRNILVAATIAVGSLTGLSAAQAGVSLHLGSGLAQAASTSADHGALLQIGFKKKHKLKKLALKYGFEKFGGHHGKKGKKGKKHDDDEQGHHAEYDHRAHPYDGHEHGVKQGHRKHGGYGHNHSAQHGHGYKKHDSHKHGHKKHGSHKHGHSVKKYSSNHGGFGKKKFFY